MTWPVSTNSIQLKWKRYGSNEHSLKWSFYKVITWKLLCSEGYKFFFLGGGGGRVYWYQTFSKWGGELANFWLVGGNFFILLVRETLQFLPNSSQNFKILYLMIHIVDPFLT